MFGQLMLSMVMGIFTGALKILIGKFRQNNGDEKANDLEISIRKSFGLLKTVTDKTPGKADDFVVKMVLDAVE